ncbi:glycosyltransferase family 4 protein [Aurantiacibacter spongiae]|uniref:glycosyltransferase family 4 protein n=1 Tax=Aurantiacibacter spongiae TaxID=2488860 RepID=UPI001F1BDF54|nr:glycosyltransferase family 4 protein [Aurantiacibacter spongiae]
MPRVLAVQFGSRRQYAMPAALAEAGMLEALYTDLYATPGLKLLGAPLKALGGSAATRMLSRNMPDAVARRTKVFPSWSWKLQRALRVQNVEERVEAIDRAHRFAARSMLRAGFGGADHVLVQLMEARGLLAAAKQKNLTTITDVNIAPSTERIVREERCRFPGWEKDDRYWGDDVLEQRGLRPPTDEVIESTDIFLCPSQFVQDDLVENFAVDRADTRLLHYAANPRWFDIEPDAQPGRILFAGEASLRKGIHILAQAARLLRDKGKPYEFRVAGQVSDTIAARPETGELVFLGKLNHQQLREEFTRADIFAFPSLAEGSAGVTFEAMASGLPLVTTAAAGSVARDGKEAYIVPERDPLALAEAIECLVEDRSVRNRMAADARVLARTYSWDGFSQRLGAALVPAETNEPTR